MEITLKDDLLNHMKDSKYVFTSLTFRSIGQTKHGYVGYQITRGLWFKLRVFLLTLNDGEKQLSVVHEETFYRENEAKKKIYEIQQQY